MIFRPFLRWNNADKQTLLQHKDALFSSLVDTYSLLTIAQFSFKCSTHLNRMSIKSKGKVESNLI